MAKIPIGETELGGIFHYEWSHYYYFVASNTDYFEVLKLGNNLITDNKNEPCIISYEDFKKIYSFGVGSCRGIKHDYF